MSLIVECLGDYNMVTTIDTSMVENNSINPKTS